MPNRPNLSFRVVQLSALLMLWTGCGDATRPTGPPAAPPASPPAAPPPAPPAVPVAPPNAPPVSGRGVFYDRVSPSFIGASSYVLYEDSTFNLHYDAHGGLDYPGKFSRSGSEITFRFDGWSTAGPWIANATLRGDTLTVTYNIVMSLSDFEDGIYVRVAGQ